MGPTDRAIVFPISPPRKYSASPGHKIPEAKERTRGVVLCLKDAIVFYFFGGAPQLKQEIRHEIRGLWQRPQRPKCHKQSDAQIGLLIDQKWRKHSECDMILKKTFKKERTTGADELSILLRYLSISTEVSDHKQTGEL